jgi:hypothetical protein
VLYREDLFQVEKDLLPLLKKKMGEGIYFSHDFFPMKTYYEKEMGAPLKRFFYVVPKLKKRSSLPKLKMWAYENEQKFSKKNGRTVNIDVGLLSLESVLLATFKLYSHRVYLGAQVWGDLTYTFEKNQFHPLPWTYPDYAHDDIKSFFSWCREILKLEIKLLVP